jgi:hypothetical protein
MTSTRAREVLYESEATLRLVDHELIGLHDVRDAAEPEVRATTMLALSELPDVLEQANAQILHVLSRLRESRATLQTTALEKLASGHGHPGNDRPATNDAAADVEDACDRASRLVDELDLIDADERHDRATAGGTEAKLHDGLFLMMGALQFQDLTCQQLSQASAVLADMENRLLEVAKLFDDHTDRVEGPSGAADDAAGRVDHGTGHPDVMPRRADTRQAPSDEIFTAMRAPAA